MEPAPALGGVARVARRIPRPQTDRPVGTRLLGGCVPSHIPVPARSDRNGHCGSDAGVVHLEDVRHTLDGTLHGFRHVRACVHHQRADPCPVGRTHRRGGVGCSVGVRRRCRAAPRGSADRLGATRPIPDRLMVVAELAWTRHATRPVGDRVRGTDPDPNGSARRCGGHGVADAELLRGAYRVVLSAAVGLEPSDVQDAAVVRRCGRRHGPGVRLCLRMAYCMAGRVVAGEPAERRGLGLVCTEPADMGAGDGKHRGLGAAALRAPRHALPSRRASVTVDGVGNPARSAVAEAEANGGRHQHCPVLAAARHTELPEQRQIAPAGDGIPTVGLLRQSGTGADVVDGACGYRVCRAVGVAVLAHECAG